MKKYIFIIILLLAISYTIYAATAQVKLETGLPNTPNQLQVGQELPSYIKYLFLFGLGLISILALAQMIIGGITYILAAGNAAKVEDAKDTIFQALLGFGILLVSYLLLRTINPDLVNLRNPNLTPVNFNFQKDSEFREDINKCFINKIAAECDKLRQNQCKNTVTDQFDPCYCIQNPTAGICITSAF